MYIKNGILTRREGRRLMFKRKLFGVLMALVLVLSLSLIMPEPARAAANVTPAAGGGAISADTTGGAWTSLGAIVIAEGAPGDIDDGVFDLQVPAGFEFNEASAPDVAITGASPELHALSPATITATSITVTVAAWSFSEADTMTIGGVTPIQVRPTAGTPLANGNITMTSGVIVGVTGATNFGTLTEVAGTVNSLTIIQQPTDTLVGVAISPAVTVRATDQFTNNVPGQNVAVVLKAGTGALSGTSSRVTNASGIATFNDLSIDTIGPGKVLRFTAAAKTVDSNPFNITFAGITVAPTSGLVTTEAGGTDNFTIVLNSQPTANVTIGLTSSDITEGTASPASVTFTSGNWNTPQSIDVTGIDDNAVDGDIAYTIITAPAISADGNYNNMNASDVGVTNMDNDVAPPASSGPSAPIDYLEINILGTKKNYIFDSYGSIQRMHDEERLTSSDSNLTVTIFKNTKARDKNGGMLLSFDVSLSEEPPPPPENGHIIGLPYEFKPEGATFDPPLGLTMMYDPADLPAGISAEDLVIAYYDQDTGRWVECSCTCDPARHCITASIAHFTSFAVIACQPPPAPAAFSLSNLSIRPAEVKPGETVTVTVTITNTGGMEGVYSLVLEINGAKEASQEISVTAGGVESASFRASKQEAGTYPLDINGLTGSFNVVAPAPTPKPAPVVTPPAEVKLPPPPPPATATPSPSPPPTQPAPATTPPGPESATNWLLIGIVAAVAVVIFVFLTFKFIIRRKSD
jgi:hypothetical protein